MKLGAAAGLCQLGVSSEDGKNCRNRSSTIERSTIVFSLITELYCCAVFSSVLPLSTTSMPKVRSHGRIPGMRLCSGVMNSVAMTFSLVAQIPESV